MLHPIVRTLVKLILASLVLGVALSHFGITVDQLMHRTGLTGEQIEAYAQRGLAWSWPKLLLGSLVIVPVWFLLCLFRPPRRRGSSSD
jgi:hypothetical protein